MKDKVIKPPIKKSVSIVLMVLFGVLAIVFTGLSVNSISALKKDWELAENGELVYAEFDGVFKWISTGRNTSRYWVYVNEYVYCDDNGNMYYVRGWDQFSTEEEARAFAASNDNKLAIKIDGEGNYILSEDMHSIQLAGIILGGVFIIICYVISRVSRRSLIRRIKDEKNPPSGWRYIE